jgi:hypothetical protein
VLWLAPFCWHAAHTACGGYLLLVCRTHWCRTVAADVLVRADTEKGDADRENGDAERDKGDADRDKGDADREKGDADGDKGDAEEAPAAQSRTVRREKEAASQMTSFAKCFAAAQKLFDSHHSKRLRNLLDSMAARNAQAQVNSRVAASISLQACATPVSAACCETTRCAQCQWRSSYVWHSASLQGQPADLALPNILISRFHPVITGKKRHLGSQGTLTLLKSND